MPFVKVLRTFSFIIFLLAFCVQVSVAQDAQADYNQKLNAAEKLYFEKSYDAAKNAFQAALQIKPDESHPKLRIREIDKLLGNSGGTSQYGEAIKEADALYDAGKYTQALEAYKIANEIDPEQDYATDRILEVYELIKRNENAAESYQNALDRGTQLFKDKKYQEAKAEFEDALSIKPGEKYPSDKLAEISSFLTIQENYNVAIAKADEFYVNQEYESAKAAYQEASGIKPDEAYPKSILSRIDELIAKREGEEQARQQGYDDAIARADAAFGDEDYLIAKASYEEAAGFKPTESYPKAKTTEIDNLLADIESRDQQYAQAIEVADELYGDQDYQQALEPYQVASQLKPDENYPLSKISEIENLLAEKEIDGSYQASISAADEYFDNEDFVKAQSEYQTASGLKPEEDYPKTKLTEISSLLAGLAETDAAYETAVTNADQFFANENYEQAQAEYQTASGLKSEEEYPKSKLTEISVLMAGIAETDAAYQTSITNADQFFADGSYEQAQSEYQTASDLKSDEEYPKTKLTEISTLLAGIAEKDAAYQTAITNADQFFADENYEQATAEYQTASVLKSEEEYPKTKLTEISALLAGIAEKDVAYQTSITNADQFFADGSYEQAQSEYQTASGLKPDEDYPKTKLTEISTLLAGIAETDAAYQTSITNANQFFADGSYEQAQAEYQTASSLKPEEDYPKSKLTEISTLLDGLAETDAAYQTSITNADQFFADGSYGQAQAEYQTASGLKPDEDYPKTKLTEISTLLAGIAETDAAYQTSITNANQFFADGNYGQAQSEYQTASSLKPEEEYPKTKLTEIRALLAGLAETDAAYQTSITNADQFFADENYEQAKSEYQTASNLKPEEEYPKTKLTEITALLAGLAETDAAYQSSITNADQFFADENYEQAKSEYQTASNLKPEEEYPKTKLTEISTLLAGIAETDAAYQTSITNADQFFADGSYEQAQSEYQTASNLKPEEDYPKTKLTEISALLAGIAETDAAYQTSITNADQFFADASYEQAQAEYKTASGLKPEENYPKTKLTEILTLLSGIAETEVAYETAITNADQLFDTKNYDQAKTGYQAASEIKPDELYPKAKIREINDLILNAEQAALALKQEYDGYVASGDFQFDAENYHEAKTAYLGAADLFPEEKYPEERLKEINSILAAELERVQKDYNQAISEADRFYNSKVFDNAIYYYSQAAGIKPDESYPRDRINEITKLIAANVVVDVVKGREMIDDNVLKKYDFNPVSRVGRKESYIVVKATNMSDKDFRLFLNYGKDGAKNGGFVINIPKSSNQRDYIIKVGGQYKWVSNDNNWLSLQPEGGSIQVSYIQVSQE